MFGEKIEDFLLVAKLEPCPLQSGHPVPSPHPLSPLSFHYHWPLKKFVPFTSSIISKIFLLNAALSLDFRGRITKKVRSKNIRKS